MKRALPIILAAMICLPALMISARVLSKPEVFPPKYVHIEVYPGETLWDISKMWMPNVDPRQGVEWIRKINNIDNGQHIHPGQILMVPAEYPEIFQIEPEANNC